MKKALSRRRRFPPELEIYVELDARDAGAADTAEPTIVTAPLPPQILPRALATPSLLAHILSDKLEADLLELADGLLLAEPLVHRDGP